MKNTTLGPQVGIYSDVCFDFLANLMKITHYHAVRDVASRSKQNCRIALLSIDFIIFIKYVLSSVVLIKKLNILVNYLTSRRTG